MRVSRYRHAKRLMRQPHRVNASIEKTLAQLSKPASDHPDAAALVRSFHEMSGAQRQTLNARLHAVAGNITIPDGAVAELDGGGSGYPVSTALRHASLILNQAIFGYAMLRTIALRFRDSPVAGEGSTGDIAEQHSKNYACAGGPLDCRLVVHPNVRKGDAARYLVTNLELEAFTPQHISDDYRLRWQVEFLFKEWKSHANLHAFDTSNPHIVEGLIWASLCAATVKRYCAHMTQRVFNVAMSTQTVAKCTHHVLGDVLGLTGTDERGVSNSGSSIFMVLLKN